MPKDIKTREEIKRELIRIDEVVNMDKAEKEEAKRELLTPKDKP